jgi:hypothetical protein
MVSQSSRPVTSFTHALGEWSDTAVVDGEPSIQEAHMGKPKIALVALAVTCVLIAVTASAMNAIAITEAQRNNLTHGSAAQFGGSAPGHGIVRVAVPPGQKAFPAELVPVP